MMRQRRFVLSDLPLRLTFTQAKPEFTLIANAAVAGTRIRITSARWFVKRVKLTPAAFNFNIEQMAKEKALYPIDRTLFYQQQETNKTEFKLKDILSGPLPSHVIVTIGRASAFEENITQNPYNFANYGLTRLQLTAVSREVPENAYESVFNGTNVAGASICREYLSTLEVAGKIWGNDSNLIDLTSYVGGSAIYAFDLTADDSQAASRFSAPSLQHQRTLSRSLLSG